ncbi:heme exporter protein CcmB [Paucibacter sediminis]|uniref:Heme exporter protein B n=1 Tax=Paucibacter sediminis TaxID=3019553 RepID=A0AA95SS51_9BURK|nr:heme exporter protein CcmB [Paucibacter sp. S2-9]WIT14046.1 heme exporter protein CcmB [Paucibacter sp. S2-9]
MRGLLWAVTKRDLLLARRRRVEALLPLGFFVVAAGLFPIAIGPEPNTLKLIGPGVAWVCALLAAMLSVTQMFASDHHDGSLEQMLLAAERLEWLVLGKVLAHWLSSGVPLVLASPLIGVLFDMQAQAIATLALSLLLGTPVLSLLGAVGAALTLGLRSGASLVFLLVLPLTVPTLIFGTGAVGAVDAGLSPQAHLSLQGALLLLTLLGAPLAAAAALRISLD